MKHVVLAALAAIACACTPAPATKENDQTAPPHAGVTLPMADAAGNRMEALTDLNGRFHSADGKWGVTRTVNALYVEHNGANTELVRYDGVTETPTVWPVIVRNGRNDESILVGLTWPSSEMYSGGGANASRVTLYRFDPGTRSTTEVLTFPSSASVSIRACFDEDDRVARHDACSDEYIFGSDLALDESNASGPARLVLQTTATTFPGVRSRYSSDSTQEAPLQESDLVAAADSECSYRRVLTFNGTAYEYDTPPPVCDNYRLQSEE
jgi:hypothetical protein